MGKIVSKLTGADKAAKAAREGARLQAEATRQASETAAASARESAAQAARQQEAAAARAAAEGRAADALKTPVENPEVMLDEATDESAAGAARKRRQQFGIGAGATGVNI